MQVLPGKLKAEELIPSFTLPSAGGSMIGPRMYHHRRSLVLFFFHDGRCQVCERLLTDFAGRYDEIRSENGEVLAVTTASAGDARAMANRLNLPFPLLYDTSGKVVERFTQVEQDSGRVVPSVVITDRFGAVYTTLLVHETKPPSADAVLEWLNFIELQCPE
ncbi:MAG TPA: redoxin domain-containing protein [Chloroflexota bacterium]|nr:redoxin domain-containing protein [Chloroflexota bacterium]